MRLCPSAALRTALDRVCRGLGKLGFHVHVEALSTARATLRCATCPLRPLVVSHPAAAAIDVGMWRRLVTAATAEAVRDSVAVSTHDCLDGDKSCRILVRFRT
jgi:hypothetical protein